MALRRSSAGRVAALTRIRYLQLIRLLVLTAVRTSRIRLISLTPRLSVMITLESQDGKAIFHGRVQGRGGQAGAEKGAQAKAKRRGIWGFM